jgi:hypothetical protein
MAEPEKVDPRERFELSIILKRAQFAPHRFIPRNPGPHGKEDIFSTWTYICDDIFQRVDMVHVYVMLS